MTFHDLHEIYRDKERVLDAMEKTVRPLSASQLSFRPSPGAWTVAEIVEHVSIVETAVIRLVRSLTQKAESARGTVPGPLEVTLDDGLRSGETGKIKTRAEFEPTGNVPAGESLQNLRSIQAAFVDLRPRLAAVDLSSVKFPHPALGALTLGEWCALFGVHEERHLSQIRSVAASPAFPR